VQLGLGKKLVIPYPSVQSRKVKKINK